MTEDEKLAITHEGISESDSTPEIEEDAGKPTIGKGLKKMTPKQMITRLPILLAQLKAGNNSQKLKNKIRQIAYSLYRPKNLTKTVFNHLINSI